MTTLIGLVHLMSINWPWRLRSELWIPLLIYKHNVYGAALVSEDGVTWVGSHYSNVGYDSITPVLSAVINWRNSYPLGTVSEKHLKLSKLVLASYNNMPKPFYRDRQAILELDEILRRYTGSKTPLPVEIVDASRRTNGIVSVSAARSTDVEKWLPHPFTPGAFRMDDVMEAQLAQLIGSYDVRKFKI